MSQFAVELRDQLSIDTPELVELEFSIAGLGSRSLACLIDYAIQGTAFLLFLLAIAALSYVFDMGHSAAVAGSSSPSGVWMAAVITLIIFIVQWGYFTLFETFWHGRTPGKRIFRLRVMQQAGRSITFMDALSRNLLRIIDFLPGLYLVGMIFLFSTKRCQRLGDMVAGTIVIHEQKITTSMWDGNGARSFIAPLEPFVESSSDARSTGLPADVIAMLTLADVAVMESFAARRMDLPLKAGDMLAAKLAAEMAQKMGAVMPEAMSDVDFLAALAFERRAMGRQ